jgi:hypothetical protein
MAIFYPASQALLPRLVPGEMLQQASAVSRLAMNGGQMAGAVVAGFCVAAFGPGWALIVCGAGLLSTVPLLLSIRVTGFGYTERSGMLRDLRDGWSEFRSHIWLWAIVAQFGVILMAWYGGFQVLGPWWPGRAWVARPPGADHRGRVGGPDRRGLVSLRFTPRRPMLFVVVIGGACALSRLSLAMLWPLSVICLTAFGLGITMEIMMVQWTVALAKRIPPQKLARVSSYDALGSVMAMPVGALVAGPITAAIGVSAAQYGAAQIVIASADPDPRDVRHMRRLPGAGRRRRRASRSRAGWSRPVPRRRRVAHISA